MTGSNTLDVLGLTAATPSSVAYGLRKLSSTYNGPAMQIRRSSDGEVRDVYFDGTGVLSLSSQVSVANGGDATATTLSSWIGSNSGTVAIWYDQSGKWKNASQSTAANQPTVINAGAINTQNGKPAIFLNGTSSYLTESTTSVSNPYSMNTVAARTASNGGYQRLINLSSTSDDFGFMGASVGNYATFAGNGSSWNDTNADAPATAIGTSSSIMTMTVSTGAGGLLPYINGAGETAKNGTAGTSTGFLIGAPYGAALTLSQLWTGYISDFEIFPSSLNYSNRSTLECNQSSYYGVSIAAPSISLGATTPISVGITSVNLPYTSASGSSYSITWNASAASAGFVNVSNVTLPTSPISIAVPASGPVAGSSYTGVFTVQNTCGTVSANYNVAVFMTGSNTLDVLGLTAATPSSVAYGLRKLSSTYNGPAMQIRRSSDGEVRDVYFDGTGVLSLSSQVSVANGGDATATTLSSWIGSNSGTVAIWYDQSGKWKNASQSTAANQPTVINAGAINTQNGKPAIFLNGTSSYLTESTTSVSNPYSMNTVAARTASNGGYQRLINLSSTSDDFGFMGASVGNYATFAGNGSSWNDTNADAPATAIGTSSSIMTMTVSTGAGGLLPYINGAGETAKNGTAGTSTGFVIGAPVPPLTPGNFTQLWTGYISDFEIFSSILSTASRGAIECNQSTFYSVALSVPTITLGTITPVPVGSTTATLPYTTTTGSPTTYSITWSASAISAGFPNVTSATLPVSPFSLAVGASAAAGITYTGTLTVANTCGTPSTNYSISLSILNSILGLTPSTTASYSLRKLSPTYAGAAIQVRRSIDNTTQDIGFTAGGDLDQSALLTFVGVGSGFVSIWYDQSGYGLNATQATLSAQPRIVNAGVVDVRNGKPTLIFYGSQTLQCPFSAVQATTGGNITTSNFVFQNATITSSLFSDGDAGTNRYNLHAPWSDGSTYFDVGNISSGGRISGALPWPNFSIGTFRRSGTQGDVWQNGTNSITGSSFSSTVTNAANMWIGSYNGSQYFINGSLSEMTVFPSALSTADRVSLECNQSAYYTISLANATSSQFYIQGTVPATSCNSAIEQVVWNVTSLSNTQATGNNLTKGVSGGTWNGGAASWNTVNNNGYLQFTASETNTYRMVGLSTTYTSSSYTTIQYAIYMVNNGTLQVYESGTLKGTFGTYATGDLLKVAVESNVVKYYQNGILLYTSAVVPTLPLLVDVSIYDLNGTVTNALVSNTNAGTFTATALNAGTPSYQWILNAGNVGSNSSTYTNGSLNNGDVMNCVITYTGICGSTTVTSNSITMSVVGATATWTGATNSNWYTSGNWSSGTVPDRTTSVTIPSGTTNNLILTSAASVYDIVINPSATFTINGTNQLSVYRNFTNNGTFTANSSTVNFVSCSSAGVISGTQTFYNVIVNTPFGLTISSGITQVANNVTFTKGVVIQNATLLFLAGSSATGANNASYVNGPVQKAGTTAFVFPTGSALRFSPIGIGIPTASTTYTAQYFSSPFGTYTTAATPAPVLDNVSGREYWTLNQTVGSGNATVTLYWQDSQYSQINNCTTTYLRVARFNGTTWENNNNAVTTTGSCSLSSVLTGSVSTTAVVTKFGPFTFGSLSSSFNPLPIELINFQAQPRQSSVELTWATASELNNDYFELQRSNQGENFAKIATVKGQGTTAKTSSYNYQDVTPYSGKNYYRLKQVDFDGNYTFSNVVVADIDGTYFRLSLFPNPSSPKESMIALESSDTNTPVQVIIHDTMGKLISSSELAIGDGNPKSTFSNDQSVASGVYIVTVVQGSKRQSLKLVVVN